MLHAAFPRIGIFDSGIGGLSVLRSVRARLPGAAITYIADTRTTPWGERPTAWVTARCLQLADWLVDDGCDLVLVACNTATTQAIAALRARWPGMPFVGVEPGIKPAVASSRSGRVAVMATPGTLRSARLQALMQAHGQAARVTPLPCPGLVEAIESVDADPAPLDAQLDRIAGALRDSGADTVVLGCTHYPLVADALQRRLAPGVHLLDTADAVARRVVQLLGPARRADAPAPGIPGLRLLATADPAVLHGAARRWLGTDAAAGLLALPDLPAAGCLADVGSGDAGPVAHKP